MAQRRLSKGPALVLRDILTGGLVLLALIAAVAIYAVMTLRNSDQRTSLIGLSMPFILASSKGGAVDSRDLLGKPYAMFFGFTHCPEVCPTTLYEMSQSLTELGPKAEDFRIFFITVDPERDTVAVMADYIGNFDLRIEALVPTPEQLQKLASDFRVFYEKVPTSDGGYTMNHTALVYLMDANGQFSGTIAFEEAKEMRQRKLLKLLGG